MTVIFHKTDKNKVIHLLTLPKSYLINKDKCMDIAIKMLMLANKLSKVVL